MFLVSVVLGALPLFDASPTNWRGAAPNFVILLLLFLLGWAAFGPPIHG